MGNKWNYDCWTPEEKKNYDELQKEREQLSYEYELADEIVRASMALFEEPDLQTLRNAMSFAHSYLDDELGEDEEKDQELGLDVWMAKQEEVEAKEEQERLDQEKWEEEQQQEEERLEEGLD